MRKYLFVFLVLGVALAAQERVDLTTPVTTTRTSYEVNTVRLEIANRTVTVELTDNLVGRIIKEYNERTTPTGATILHALNTGNFSTNSLMKAIYNRLITDGVIPAGSVVGTPQ